MKKILTYDIAVIGSGGAGCAAAIEAHERGATVCIITKGAFESSKTARAQGGIQAPLHDLDSPEIMTEDILKAGNYKNKVELVKKLAGEAVATIQWLESIGIEFDCDENGQRMLGSAAGLTHPRIVSCGDKSGNKILGPLRRKVEALDIHVYENFVVTDIAPIDDDKGRFFRLSNSIAGSERDDKSAQTEFDVIAKSVVLATGGTLPKEKRIGKVQGQSFNGKEDTLDVAAALGLKLIEPDLLQFHPTGILRPVEMRRKPIPETVRSHGAYFVNKHGDRFVDPMLTRNQLSETIVEECKRGNGIEDEAGNVGVHLVTPEVDRIQGEGFLEKKFPSLFKDMLALGHDISKAPVLVYPVVHYSLGGIEIDAKCRTSVAGVYAAGEATWGVHGEDRLMGNSLLEVFLFGRTAGIEACKYSMELNNG